MKLRMKYLRYEKNISQSRIAQIILAIKAFSPKPETTTTTATKKAIYRRLALQAQP